MSYTYTLNYEEATRDEVMRFLNASFQRIVGTNVYMMQAAEDALECLEVLSRAGDTVTRFVDVPYGVDKYTITYKED